MVFKDLKKDFSNIVGKVSCYEKFAHTYIAIQILIVYLRFTYRYEFRYTYLYMFLYMYIPIHTFIVEYI